MLDKDAKTSKPELAAKATVEDFMGIGQKQMEAIMGGAERNYCLLRTDNARVD